MTKKSGKENQELMDATYDAMEKSNTYDHSGFGDVNRNGFNLDENAYDCTTSHFGQMQT